MEPETEVPELLPARMVNAFTYCPRLFYLEWVNVQFADNADTVEGRWVHRAVDETAGRVPLPGEGEVAVARSVKLSSVGLGLVARIDLLRGEPDGSVVPVETKKGSSPDLPRRAWDTDLVQLGVQALLLREHGYRCDRAVLWFAETRERVDVVVDDELISMTLDQLSGMREVAGSSVPPPPLVDSRKCPRCSLVGICLPDEVNTLSDRQTTPPRRLIPRDDAPKPLYVTEQGAWIGKDKGRIEITKKGEKLASVRLLDVSQVCMYGNIQLSAQLIRELFARDIPVCWFSYGGWFSGLGSGLPARNVELRRRQVVVAAQGGLEIARQAVWGKIRNSRTLLRRNTKEPNDRAVAQLAQLASQASTASSAPTLLGIEGAAARIYFGSFQAMLSAGKRLPGGPFTFEGRRRRPPPDPVNCLLGYLYGLLVKELTVTVLTVGFDPYQGFYHRPRFGRPALALDLAEEFRPLVAESVAINLINNGEVSEGDFLVRAGGVSLTQSGRKTVLGAYERRMAAELTHPVFGYKVSYRRTLEVQARLLAAHLLGEVPEYTPVTTR
ncbi:MAG: CRISPR-associated endonuclease Cas1 [Acidimicrobiales bacterium]|nr:CRISPR-associated endonuclease Cas1 [Acidimicrobiales bacterium]